MRPLCVDDRHRATCGRSGMEVCIPRLLVLASTGQDRDLRSELRVANHLRQHPGVSTGAGGSNKGSDCQLPQNGASSCYPQYDWNHASSPARSTPTGPPDGSLCGSGHQNLRRIAIASRTGRRPRRRTPPRTGDRRGLPGARLSSRPRWVHDGLLR